MTTPEQEERVEQTLEGLGVSRVEARDRMPTFTLEPAVLPDALQRLREDGGFETITLITCVDHLVTKHPEPRFEVVYQLLSITSGERVRLKARVSESAPEVPTCTHLWPGAAYMEREVFDLFGIVFTGHADLKRLLMPDGYGHHPLRKDFPHQGIEPDRLYREWDRERRKTWNPGR